MPLALFRSSLLRVCVIWALAYALPLAGLSLAISQWLGAMHVHPAAPAATPHAHTALPTAAGAWAVHAHATPSRHHHGPTQTGVLRLAGDALSVDIDQADSPAFGWGLTVAGDRGLQLQLRAGLAHAPPEAAAWTASHLRHAPPLRPPDRRTAAAR